MKFFVIGANGKTGTQLIDLALPRGHEVTAFVRSPEKIERRHARLQIVRGDPHDADRLAEALPGHDAVFSALGIRPRELFGPITLVQEGAASTVAAMTRAEVKRLFIVSAATLFAERGLLFTFFRWLLKEQIRDLVAAETIVQATSLDWTIVRPPRLVRRQEQSYRWARGRLPKGALSMSFRAVAAFMLDAAEQGTHGGEIVGLAG
jgi:putative NADH-flavin reductase